MKNFKNGLYLFLIGIGILVGLMASNALEEGNTKLAQQIIMAWVGVIAIGICFIGGFIYSLKRK